MRASSRSVLRASQRDPVSCSMMREFNDALFIAHRKFGDFYDVASRQVNRLFQSFLMRGIQWRRRHGLLLRWQYRARGMHDPVLDVPDAISFGFAPGERAGTSRSW